ncbi:hypothetical protein ACJMK2_003871 [Sinanodonta woodiana]|uniref:MKRN2 opposite strand protein n=1 Tax=Sinanodonta woodiana TaxID=1069815 RepID=A0ABD3Y186_SINWO
MVEPPDEDIRCFQHCQREVNILCFRVPDFCPICKADVRKSASRIPPYLITSPFTNAAQTQYSVVIKPTIGTFLRDYTNQSNLHVGVTDSHGTVYDYDEDGVNINSQGWEKCVVLELTQHISGEFMKRWDEKLLGFSQHSDWTKYRYDESSWNCFDFVIQFLQALGMDQVYPQIRNRSSFCQDFVQPKTYKAAQYITLYRDIKQLSYVCQPSQIT